MRVLNLGIPLSLMVRGGRESPLRWIRCTLVSGGGSAPDIEIQCVETLIDSGLRRGTTHSRDLSGRGAAMAKDAQGTPHQSHTSPSKPVYEDKL